MHMDNVATKRIYKHDESSSSSQISEVKGLKSAQFTQMLKWFKLVYRTTKMLTYPSWAGLNVPTERRWAR